MTDGSVDQADDETHQYLVQRMRRDAYAEIEKNNGEHCYDLYWRLARFLKPEDKPVFEKLLSDPGSNYPGAGQNSGPDKIYYFFALNQYRELAERVLAAFDNGQQDAIGEIRHFDRETGYRNLGTLELNATFPEVPKDDDGIIVLWLESIDGNGADNDRPGHALGIRLRFTGSKLVLPLKMYFYGVTPGTYRVRGYWNQEVDHPYNVRDDYWKRTGQYTIADSPKIEIKKGKALDVALSFAASRDISAVVKNGLSLSVRSAKPEFDEQEQLEFVVTMKNVSAKAFRLFDPTFYAKWKLEFLPGPWQAKYRHDEEREHESRTLNPGEELSIAVKLESKDYVWQNVEQQVTQDHLKPGTYQFGPTIKFHSVNDDNPVPFWTGEITAKPGTFTISGVPDLSHR